MSTPVSTVPTSSADDKTTAILAYLTLIGFIVAIVLHSSKKTVLGAYHLRQSLGLMITSIALMIASTILGFIPIIGWLTSLALTFAILALWVMGLINAVKGELKPIPVVGQHFEKWFAGAFN